MMSYHGPPRLAEMLLRLAVRDRSACEGLLGDLEEEYSRLAGRGAAPSRPRLWYWRAILANESGRRS